MEISSPPNNSQVEENTLALITHLLLFLDVNIMTYKLSSSQVTGGMEATENYVHYSVLDVPSQHVHGDLAVHVVGVLDFGKPERGASVTNIQARVSGYFPVRDREQESQ